MVERILQGFHLDTSFVEKAEKGTWGDGSPITVNKVTEVVRKPWGG